nr:MAG TPA: hypothetical protein [Caudoviricetes sp.]
MRGCSCARAGDKIRYRFPDAIVVEKISTFSCRVYG